MSETKKLNNANQILGRLFGYKQYHEPNDKNLDKAIYHFREYLQRLENRYIE